MKGLELVIKKGNKNGKDWHLLLGFVDVLGHKFPVVKEFVFGDTLKDLISKGVQVEEVKAK